MKFGQTLSFDSEEYQETLKDYCDDHLRDNERTKRQERAGSATGMGMSLATAAHTGGLSLAGGALAKRKHYVAGKKHKYILQEMEERGLLGHEHKKRDFLVPIAASLTAGAIAQGIGLGMEHAAAASAGTHAYDVCMSPVEIAPGYWVEQVYYVPDAAGNAAYAAFQSGEQHVVEYVTRNGTQRVVRGGGSQFDYKSDEYDRDDYPDCPKCN